MTVEAFSDGLLGWIIRIAGLFWLVGAFMLYRQIRMEMMLDRMTSRIETMTREFEAQGIEDDDDGYGNIDAPVKRAPRTTEERAIDRWTDRDDAARRGWIAAQSVVLGITALAMILLHPMAAWRVALLVIGQGAYFVGREYTARHAPSVTPTTALNSRHKCGWS